MFEVESDGDHFLIGPPFGVTTVTADTYLKLAGNGMPHAENVERLEVDRWAIDALKLETDHNLSGIP